MPKILTQEQELEEAHQEYHDLMLENIKLSKQETKIKLERQSAFSRMSKARERLRSLEVDLLSM